MRLNPKDIHAIKSLGFVYSAQGKIELAIEQYQNAIQIDQNAWRSWINLGELLKLNNQPQASLDAFVQAFEAMQAKFQEEPQHIGPWQPELGKIIVASYFETGDFEQTSHWASRVLQLVPFDPPATRLLVAALNAQGKRAEATRICEAYPASLPKVEACLIRRKFRKTFSTPFNSHQYVPMDASQNRDPVSFCLGFSLAIPFYI